MESGWKESRAQSTSGKRLSGEPECGPRLRTYGSVKVYPRHERYLDCTEGKKRRALIEFRSGAVQTTWRWIKRREKKELKDSVQRVQRVGGR